MTRREETMASQNRRTTARDNKGRFLKGSSGNPGGKPPGIEAKAREYSKDGEIPLEYFKQVVKGKVKGATVRDKLDAGEKLLRWGYGMPTQRQELSGPGGGPIQQEIDELDTEELVLLRAKMEEIKAERAKAEPAEGAEK